MHVCTTEVYVPLNIYEFKLTSWRATTPQKVTDIISVIFHDFCLSACNITLSIEQHRLVNTRRRSGGFLPKTEHAFPAP